MTEAPLPLEASGDPPASEPPAPEAAPARRRLYFERLAAAVRRQGWFVVALEVAIVIVGVVIGFQVTAWGNERAARAQEQELLQGLQTEFTDALVRLERQAGKHARIERDLTTILDALGRAEQAGAASVPVADTTIAWALVPTTTQFSQGVLDGMLRTGRLQLVQDRELRTALAEWPGVLADVTEDEEASRDIVVYQLEPLLWRLMDVRSARTYDLLLGTLPPSAMEATSDVPVNRELTGVLSTRRFWQRHTIREFSGPREEATRILALIDRSLTETAR